MPTDRSGDLPGQSGEHPGGPIEERIAQIWLEILESHDIGYHENFFTLSGRSIDAVRLVNRLGSVFGVDLTVRAIFEAPTIAQLATVIQTAPRASGPRLQAGEAGSS
jgi:acyl carrier protein